MKGRVLFMKKVSEVLNEMKSLTFSGAFPKTVCNTIFNGVLTKDVMNEMNKIMHENGFRYHFASYSSDWENFKDFRPGNGTILPQFSTLAMENPYTNGVFLELEKLYPPRRVLYFY